MTDLWARVYVVTIMINIALLIGLTGVQDSMLSSKTTDGLAIPNAGNDGNVTVDSAGTPSLWGSLGAYIQVLSGGIGIYYVLADPVMQMPQEVIYLVGYPFLILGIMSVTKLGMALIGRAV